MKGVRILKIALCAFLLMVSMSAFTQTTSVTGVVTDSVTGEFVEFAVVKFDESSVGGLTDNKGSFKLSNKQKKTTVIVSQLGYETWQKTVPLGEATHLDVKLKPIGIQLNELVVKPGKERYSKKDNPAVTLIKKVIANKHKYSVTNQSFYQAEEYDRMLFALNDFDEKNTKHKLLSSIAKYKDSSKIDSKTILPISLREKLSTYYYRKDPKAIKRIVKAQKIDGLDEGLDVQAIDAVVKELFHDVDITENNINLLFRDFVGPLSTQMSVDFYKWYIIDTVQIDQKQYINLGFVPFNNRDVGFIGNLYITNDTTYALRRVSMHITQNANLNFVDALLIEQDFEEVLPDIWTPRNALMAMDLSLAGSLKVYVEKVVSTSNYEINQPVELVFVNPAPELYVSDYKDQTPEYWNQNRPDSDNRNYRVDMIMSELRSNKAFNILLNAVEIYSKGFIPTTKDPDKSKLNIGTPLTFFSFNGIEGARFRLTGKTTPVFNKHLFLNGYAAIGTKDLKAKYMSEVTWSFKEQRNNKDEFPIHSISVGHKYDINTLGQRFLQAERDNILMSGRIKADSKITYARQSEIVYNKEYQSGFSYKLFAQTVKETAAGGLRFEMNDDNGNLYHIPHLTSSEAGIVLRYAPGEKFFQQNSRRVPIPYNGFVYTLSYTAGLKGVFGSDYEYNKLSFNVSREIRLAQFGKLLIEGSAEKLWGEATFSSLFTPNVNNSIFIQRGAFSMIDAMEFINDQQYTLDAEFRLGGWLFNRLPLFRVLGWREVAGFRGFWGTLSDKNNPVYNNNLLLFPNDVHSLGKDPYMEINLGIENIFKVLRIDYIRRLNYLNYPGIKKDGFKIGAVFSF